MFLSDSVSITKKISVLSTVDTNVIKLITIIEFSISRLATFCVFWTLIIF